MHLLNRLVITFVGAAAFALPALAQAQAYPSRQIRIVVPVAPGGSTDITSRQVAERLRPVLGQTVVIDNRPGASTIIGTGLVAKAPPDGYTLLAAVAPFSANATLFAGKLPYDTNTDFSPILLVRVSPLVLVVNASKSIQSVQELIALAKASPGKLNFGSSATGGVNHLSGELLNFMTGVNTVHISYNGEAPAATDLMGGRLDFAFSSASAVIALVNAGKLRAIGVSVRNRLSILPDVPTMDEVGLKGFQSSGWLGFVGPAGLPAAIISRLNVEVNKIIRSDEMQILFKTDGSSPGSTTPEQFTAFIREETETWARVIKAANITVQQ